MRNEIPSLLSGKRQVQCPYSVGGNSKGDGISHLIADLVIQKGPGNAIEFIKTWVAIC